MSGFTPGPWRWELNEKSRQINLVGGVPTFDLTVLDFIRWGMGGAAVRFREDAEGMNIMHHCQKSGVVAKGREHHASWFKLIDHPDANLIASAPDLLAACKAALKLIQFGQVHEQLASAISRAEGGEG